MTGVVEGFATIIAVIALGAFLAHVGVVDLTAQRVLARLSFFVASPALLVTVLQDTDVSSVVSRGLVANAASVVVVVAIYAAVAVVLLRQGLAETVVGSLCAGYVNAGNLGLPIAAYVLGDAALVAPALLMQLLVLQPLALTLLDIGVSERRLRWWDVVSRPFRNALTVGTLIGLVLSATDSTLPQVIDDPLHLVGGMAVPSMLIAYGISLRLGPRPGTGGGPRVLATIVVLKQVVQPAVAYLVGHFLLGMDGVQLLAVVIMAALPTAQNVFVIASRYDRSVVLARDAVFASTLLSVPTITVVAALLA